MCMKYVNSVTTCYSSMKTENDSILSFNMPITGLNVDNSNHPLINHLIILTQFNFLGTNDPLKKKDSVLESGEKIEIIIRLTKCSKDENQRLGYDLDRFEIDFSKVKKENLQQTACFDFYDYMRITTIDDFELPVGIGKYVIKVLIKRAADSDFTIQSITNLTIEERII